jgi:hypothetical protein
MRVSLFAGPVPSGTVFGERDAHHAWYRVHLTGYLRGGRPLRGGDVMRTKLVVDGAFVGLSVAWSYTRPVRAKRRRQTKNL